MNKLITDNITIEELLDKVEERIKKILNEAAPPQQESFTITKSIVARHFKRSYPTVNSAIRRAIADSVLPAKKHNEYTLDEWKTAFAHYEGTRYSRGEARAK